MAWQDVMESGIVRARESPLDSARFGYSVERLTVPAGPVTPFSAVRESVMGSSADVIVLRYPAEHVGWFAELTMLGRVALFADSLEYWRLRAGRGRAPVPSPDLLVTALTDPATVQALVSDIFAEYGNHYLANPLFDVGKVTAGYQEWAARSAAEGCCLVLRDRSKEDALGLATVDENGSRTEILLAGIVLQAQGRSLYAHLLKEVEDRTVGRGGAEIVISTQGHNVRVQRAWARYGFEPVHSVLTVHLIRSRLLRARQR